MAVVPKPARPDATESATAGQPLRHLVHVFPTFAYGGVPIRIADVISRLERPYRHSIVALDRRTDAGSRIDPKVDVAFPEVPQGRLPGLVRTIAQWLTRLQPDLLLTYNWGAIEWALSNRLTTRLRHIHFESGFGPEEADRQLWRRSLFRHFALGAAERLVVPSHNLVRIASRSWRIDPAKILLLPNGVDLSRFRADAARPDLLAAPGPETRIRIGTLAPLRPEKAIDRLLRAAAPLVREGLATLVIAGEGNQRNGLKALAEQLEIAEGTDFPGHIEDVAGFLPLLDVFCMTSETEQMPNALLQAMASERPVVAVDVGDVRRILSSENRAFVVPREQESAFTDCLRRLVGDPDMRQYLGRANRRQAETNYDLRDMVAAYDALYRQEELPAKLPRTL